MLVQPWGEWGFSKGNHQGVDGLSRKGINSEWFNDRVDGI